MTDFSNQPFFSLLEQAANQTVDLRDFEQLLKEQQSLFKEDLKNRFFSGLSAPKRFYFLSNVDNDLCRIHHEFADKIRDADADFYRFWAMLIDDTRHFVVVSLKTLKFQAKCPDHMLADEHARTFPICNWTGKRSDLMEAIAGIYQADVIRLQDGKRPSFAVFAKEIGNVFGVTFSNPHLEMRKILNRKRDPTPFFNSIIDGLKDKSEKMFE